MLNYLALNSGSTKNLMKITMYIKLQHFKNEITFHVLDINIFILRVPFMKITRKIKNGEQRKPNLNFEVLEYL